MRKTIIMTLMVAMLVAGVAEASTTYAGKFAAPFLRVPIGPRLMTTPDIVASFQPDPTLMFANPALMRSVGQPEMFATSSNWLDDVRVSAVGVVIPLERYKAHVGVGASGLVSSDINGYLPSLEIADQQNYYDFGLRVSGAKEVMPGLQLGAGAVFIRQRLYPSFGNGAAFTLGAAYARGANRVHLAARDFGGSMSYDGVSYDIDQQFVGGFARTFVSAWGAVDAGMQVVLSDATESRLQFGVAYEYRSMFTVRTGTGDAFGSADETNGFNAGFGARYENISFDYAYTNRAYFSDTHTFAFTVRLGASEPVRRMSALERPSERTRYQAPAGYARYAVVAGEWSQLERAVAESKALSQKGLAPRIHEGDRGYHVVLGRAQSQREARRMQSSFADAGVRCYVVFL